MAVQEANAAAGVLVVVTVTLKVLVCCTTGSGKETGVGETYVLLRVLVMVVLAMM